MRLKKDTGWGAAYTAFTLFALLLFVYGNWNAAVLLLLGTVMLSQLVRSRQAVEQLNVNLEEALADSPGPHAETTVEEVLR